jgi:hypothetical protein
LLAFAMPQTKQVSWLHFAALVLLVQVAVRASKPNPLLQRTVASTCTTHEASF